MSKQFDIYRTPEDVFVVVLQSDTFDHLPTRVVAPLVSSKLIEATFKTLMPMIMEGDAQFYLLPQQVATVLVSNLGTYIGSAAHQRDEIIRATDLLLTGY